GDWRDQMTATTVLSIGALGLFMLARIAGSAVMSRIDARKVLSACAVMTVLGSLAVTAHLGTVSHIGVFVCYAFEAIMFPTIFAMTISGTGRHSKIASSFLMMTPLGGAVGAYLMGHVANMSDMSTAFLVPCAAYCVVLFYSLVNTRKKNLSSK
ncbi:MAG: glucose/galactose MFS transporter, partial [Muribaculaceae bacterium]|nr:glucose/galactose MFS transporter [Muribaculaceae bacterium]